MTYEAEPANDSFLLTIPEIGAVVCLVIGAVCAVTTRVLWRKWKP